MHMHLWIGISSTSAPSSSSTVSPASTTYHFPGSAGLNTIVLEWFLQGMRKHVLRSPLNRNIGIKHSILNQCDVWAQTTVKTFQLKSRVSMVPPKIVPGWQVYSYTTPPFGVKTWVDSQISSQCHPTLCPSPDISMRKCLWSYITIELISIVSKPIKVVIVVVVIVVAVFVQKS